MGKVIKFCNWMGENKMSKGLSIFEVANAFLNIEPVTNKKLQKLCYYAQGWYLALNAEPLIDCNFEAWIHGPVCPDLYHRYKSYGSHEIEKETSTPDIIERDEYVKTFIKNIYDVYGGLTGDDLELLTHNEEPWKNARGGLQYWEPSHNLISNYDMMSYYSRFREESLN